MSKNEWIFDVNIKNEIELDDYMLFYFELNEQMVNLSTVGSKEKYCLGTEGKLIKCDDVNFDKVYKINKRELAYKMLEKFNNKIKNEYNNNMTLFNLEYEVLKFPLEIFSEEIIFKIMKEANDRKNNILVVDGDGSPKIINNYYEATSYSVRHELWESFNNYVGKYADEEYFKYVYYSMIKCWSIYLKTKRRVLVDFEVNFKDAQESLKEITQITKDDNNEKRSI